MRKIFATIIAFAMLSVMVPGVNAHTATAEYDVPSGPNGNRGTAISTRLCAEEWDNWDGGLVGDDTEETLFGDNESNPDDNIIGPAITTGFTAACSTVRTAWADDGFKMGIFSAAIEADDDLYTDFVTTISDDNFDATFISVCIYTGGDNICQTDAESPSFRDPDGAVDYAASGCASVQVSTDGELAGGPEAGPAVFVYATYVDPDTFDLCFGSSGSVTVVMS